MISIKDYYSGSEGGFGPGGTFQAADLNALSKALTAGFGTSPSTQTGGGALRVESLEKTLHILSHRSKHAIFWQNIPKLPAYNTVEEFNQLVDYGSQGNGFVPEGVLPESEDSTYQRAVTLIKFLGTTRQITLQMLMVRAAHGDVVALETMSGTNYLLRVLERALFKANSAFIPEEFDGIDAQISADTGAPVIDCAGAPLSEGLLLQGAQLVSDNFGIPTTLYLGHRGQRDLSKSLYPKERIPVPVGGGGELGFGYAFKTMNTEFGSLALRPDVFIRPGGAAPASGATPNSPNAPSATSAATGTDSTLATGTYKYYVTAVNRFGESAKSAEVSQAATSTQHITLTITAGATVNGVAPTAYKIYRTAVGGATGTELYLDEVAALAGTYTDLGALIPGTEQAWLIQEDLENISFKQLAPFMKVPLATISSAVRWMQLLFGSPAIYSPRKNCRYINIGTN